MQRYGLIGMGVSWFFAHLVVGVSVVPSLGKVWGVPQRQPPMGTVAGAA